MRAVALLRARLAGVVGSADALHGPERGGVPAYRDRRVQSCDRVPSGPERPCHRSSTGLARARAWHLFRNLRYLVLRAGESGRQEWRARPRRRKRRAHRNDHRARRPCWLPDAASGALRVRHAEPASRAGEHSHLLRRALDGGLHRVRVQPGSRPPGGRVPHHEGRLSQPRPCTGSGRCSGTLPDRSAGRAISAGQHHGRLRGGPGRRLLPGTYSVAR